MDQSLTPKQVAQAIGVSEASLKRWCDKGLVRAVKTAGGHRRLAIEDVVEFLRSSGRRPIHPELLQLPVVRSATPLTIEESVEDFTDSLIEGNEVLAGRNVFDLYLAKTSICDIGDHLFRPALQRLGECWSQNELEPYQERRACEICGRILSHLRNVLPVLPDSAPLAIGGTLSNDAYRIPTMLVELVLREAGWRAESFGTGLPAETLCAAMETIRPKLFWLCVSHIPSVPDFLEQYKLLHAQARQFNIPIVVGGRALDGEIRCKMEYNAFCDNLRHILNFVSSLPLNTDSDH